MEKISIIVPIYKVPKVDLTNCINSLINQTYKNLEIILVDDGSPDDCPTICDNLALKDKRIKVIHQKNKGLSGARNTGVKHSTGKWYTFVDGDDYLDLNGIELLVKEIEKDIDVICTKKIHDLKIEEIKYFPYQNQKVYSTKEDLYYLRCMLLCFNGNNTSSCGKLYSKSFTDKNNLFHDEILKQGAEDLEFNFRVFSKAKKIKMLTYGIYHNVYNNNSITRSFNEDNEYLKIKCFESIKSNIPINDKEMTEWFYNRLLYSIVSSTISGFFHYSNHNPYTIQKKQFKKFLNNNLIQETLKFKNKKSIDKQRALIILLIKLRLFFIIKLLSIIRYKQKINS